MQQSFGELVVRQEGPFLELTPALDGLKQVLRTKAHVPLLDASGRLSVRKVPSLLYRERAEDDGPVLDCFAGLLPVVVRFAENAGYAVRVHGRQAGILSEPVSEGVEPLGPLDRGFLRCVQQYDRALVRYEPLAVEPAWLVAQVALAWPKRGIAVAVTRIEEARWLRDRLRTYVPDVQAVTSRNQVPDSAIGQVVIATYNALGHTGIEIEKRSIVLALNAVEASRANALSYLGHAKRARFYGLLPAGEALAPFDQDALRLLFGFQEVDVPRHGVEAIRVEVVWCRKVGGSLLSEATDLVEVKRKGLWRNHARNRQVARLARKLQTAEWQAIRQDLPGKEADVGGGDRFTVVVLVENVEHAEALKSYLPGWLVVTQNGWSTRRVDQGVNSESEFVASVTDHTQGVIATAQGMAKLDVSAIDVLVRADGGAGLPPVTSFAPGQILLRKKNLAKSPSDEPRLLLVDFEDRHHPLLRRWSRQRRIAYAERGWYAPGVNPVQERLERFLIDHG